MFPIFASRVASMHSTKDIRGRTRRVVNFLLAAVIVVTLFALYNPFDVRLSRSSAEGQNSRLLALSKAHQLDHKYLPGLVSQRNSASSLTSSSPGDVLNGNYSATIVLGRLRDEPERVEWIFNELVNVQDKQVYIVDDPNSDLPHLSKNHGREAAVYLTYIIDYYDNLNDITFFWHTDRTVWHNNLLLKWDSVQTINRMDRENIIRQGYVPSRCDHWPGCPEWIKFDPSKAEHQIDPHRLEEMFNPTLFKQLFPDAVDGEYPPFFAGTCCSQFAVSRDTIRRRPIEMYKRLLAWILEYQSDDRSGQFLEYTWPYIFLGRGTFCPSMRDCYCKTYNFCIDDQREIQQLENWNALRTRREEIKWQVTFTEYAMINKEAQLKEKGETPERISTIIESLRPELDRLNKTLEHLVDVTWQSREDIIHHWRLPPPPVGW